jgi:hypothetical protein
MEKFDFPIFDKSYGDKDYLMSQFNDQQSIEKNSCKNKNSSLDHFPRCYSDRNI